MSGSLGKRRKIADVVDLTEDDGEDDIQLAEGEHDRPSNKPTTTTTTTTPLTRVFNGNGTDNPKKTISTTNGASSLRFLVLDICVRYDPKLEMPPVIVLLGIDESRRRIRVVVNDFNNYYYAEPEKFSKETLMKEEGTVDVEEVDRAPIYYYRKNGAFRRVYKVTYSFIDKKKKITQEEGRFETDIKLKRRFQTERKLGAGNTVRCDNLQIIENSESSLHAICSHQDVISMLEDEISPQVLKIVSLDFIRTHNPNRSITGRCIEEKGDPLSIIAVHLEGEPAGKSEIVFVVDKNAVSQRQSMEEPVDLLICGRPTRIYSSFSEEEMVTTFARFLSNYDPDVIIGWDIIKDLESIADSLDLSRLDQSLKLKSKSVVNYNAHWVRRPNARMSSNSNQQTFKLTEGAEGRIILDLLRTTTTKHKLQRYTLAESIHEFLSLNPTYRNDPKRTTWMDTALEEMDQPTISGLWRTNDQASRLRLMEYVIARSIAAFHLCRTQALIPETLQAGSTALLTLSEVLYGAQMVRVHSLLLRKMYELGYISAGSTDDRDSVLSDPINAPFLIHPEDEKKTGLYLAEKDGPIAVLDFASLYPSVIIGFNLCYSTYVHPADRKKYFDDIPPPRRTGSATALLTNAPAVPETAAIERHVFVTEAVAPGVFPSLLRELLSQRYHVKQQMEDLKHHQQHGRGKEDHQAWIDVLNQRQNQLKLCANAVYGFTGATTASPLPFTAVAESVLRWGQSLCRKACSVVAKTFPECKVIYGQTDSLFICLGNTVKTYKDAETKAKVIADEITRQIGRPPVKLKLEKIFDRLLLVHVNRYAGRLMRDSTLDITGLESESRKECGLVRRAVRDALDFLLLKSVQSIDNYFDYLNRWLEFNLPRTMPSELVVTHALWRTSNVEDVTEDESQPHLAVAKRLCQKDDDLSFVLGERVSFIFRLHPEVKKQAEKARDPFEEASVAPDLALYLKNKLLPPLYRLSKVVDAKKWSVLESDWNRKGPPPFSIVPKGNRKCLGKPGCRLLTVENRALCEKCREENRTGGSRAMWEYEYAQLEHRLHEKIRGRQRANLLRDAIGKEFITLDHAHLADELTKLRTLLDERIW